MPGYSRSYATRYTLQWRPIKATAVDQSKTFTERYHEKQEIPYDQTKNKKKRI